MCVLFTRPQPPKLELHGAEDEEDRDGGAIQRTSSSATTSGLTSAALTGLTFAPSGLTFADTSLRMGEGGSIQTKGVASTPAQDNGEMLVWVWVLGCACVVLYCVCVQCVSMVPKYEKSSPLPEAHPLFQKHISADVLKPHTDSVIIYMLICLN